MWIFTLIQSSRVFEQKKDHEIGVKHPQSFSPHPWLALCQTVVILQESP